MAGTEQHQMDTFPNRNRAKSSVVPELTSLLSQRNACSYRSMPDVRVDDMAMADVSQMQEQGQASGHLSHVTALAIRSPSTSHRASPSVSPTSMTAIYGSEDQLTGEEKQRSCALPRGVSPKDMHQFKEEQQSHKRRAEPADKRPSWLSKTLGLTSAPDAVVKDPDIEQGRVGGLSSCEDAEISEKSTKQRSAPPRQTLFSWFGRKSSENTSRAETPTSEALPAKSEVTVSDVHSNAASDDQEYEEKPAVMLMLIERMKQAEGGASFRQPEVVVTEDTGMTKEDEEAGEAQLHGRGTSSVSLHDALSKYSRRHPEHASALSAHMPIMSMQSSQESLAPETGKRNSSDLCYSMFEIDIDNLESSTGVKEVENPRNMHKEQTSATPHRSRLPRSLFSFLGRRSSEPTTGRHAADSASLPAEPKVVDVDLLTSMDERMCMEASAVISENANGAAADEHPALIITNTDIAKEAGSSSDPGKMEPGGSGTSSVSLHDALSKYSRRHPEHASRLSAHMSMLSAATSQESLAVEIRGASRSSVASQADVAQDNASQVLPAVPVSRVNQASLSPAPPSEVSRSSKRSTFLGTMFSARSRASPLSPEPLHTDPSQPYVLPAKKSPPKRSKFLSQGFSRRSSPNSRSPDHLNPKLRGRAKSPNLLGPIKRYFTLSRRGSTGSTAIFSEATPDAGPSVSRMSDADEQLARLFEKAISDGELDRKASEKVDQDGMNASNARIAARVEFMIEHHGKAEMVLFFIIRERRDEGERLEHLKHLVNHGVDIDTVDKYGYTALHIAVIHNQLHTANVLLENGCKTDVKDSEGRLPVEQALYDRRDNLASRILSYMSKESVRGLFEPVQKEGDVWEAQKFNFNDFISDSKSDMGKTAESILNALVEPTAVPDQYNFFFNILESNSEGKTPSQKKDFKLGCKTNFHRVLEMENLQGHSIVRTLTHYKWRAFGETSTLKNIFAYFVFLFMLSFALISAGQQRADGFNSTMNDDNMTVVTHGDPRTYPDVESYFRALFEVGVILSTLHSLYEEIKEVRSSINFDYWKNVYNYVQLTSIGLIMVMIPLRWTDTDAQWYVGAITYSIFCLRTLRLISVTRVVGIYLQILIEIVKKDISKFAIIFSIFWVMFSGSTFLVLVGTNYSDGTVTGTDLDRVEGISSYPTILLAGLRIMMQAESVIDDYERTYHWLAVILMMFFLFTLLIVILNILIAQLSDTYQEVKSNAQRTLELNWATQLRTLELTTDLEATRMHSFTPSITKSNPESFLVTWEKPVDLTQQREGERRQRFVEHQLVKLDQQLIEIKNRLKEAKTLLEQEKVAQEKLNIDMSEMVQQQLPDVMEGIVHRNTDAVITSLGGTTARSAREIEEHVHARVVQEVMTLLADATDDVVSRVSDLMSFAEPPM